MNFDIALLSNELMEWMEEHKQDEGIKKYISEMLALKSLYQKYSNSAEIFRTIMRIFVTNGDFFNPKNIVYSPKREGIHSNPDDFDSKLESFIKNKIDKTNTDEICFKEIEETELIEFIQGMRFKISGTPVVKGKINHNVRKFLKSENIKEYTETEYILAKNLKKSILFGPKGRDLYLRDVGYWDRIPIDVHEKRFLLRTGIFFVCSSLNKSDFFAKNYEPFYQSLTRFCTNYMYGCTLNIDDLVSIDLWKSPGMVDLFIWCFCAVKGRNEYNTYNICGEVPKCEECSLKKSCLYFILNSDL